MEAKEILLEGREIGKRMEVVGEEGTALDEMVIHLKAELYDFSYLQQNFFDKEDSYCTLERQIVLFLLINKIFKAKLKFNQHDEARQYFLGLQNQIRNMNFLPFDSQEYRESLAKVEETIKSASERENRK